MSRWLRRSAAPGSLVALSLAALVATAPPAGACGGLVGENGTIQLGKTTTLAAYHDGVEHYVTSFEFTGQGEQLGSIVPLPGVPTNVERGGNWTLQRLVREVEPIDRSVELRAEAAFDAGAQVLLETKIDALEITILEGGGDEVGRWALDNGFLLTPDAPAVLDFYAGRSPIFMAARFDAATALELGQGAGDGTPIHLTIPTENPWVPLRILGLGADAHRRIEADVFLLTDDRPEILAASDDIDLVRSEAASDQLLDDLRRDDGMEWVPDEQWLSYLRLDTEAGELTYDLAVSAAPDGRPSLVDAGLALPTRPSDDQPAFDPDDVRFISGEGSRLSLAAIGVGLCALAAVVIVGAVTTKRRAAP